MNNSIATTLLNYIYDKK